MKNRILSSRVQSWCSGKSDTLHDFIAWAILEDIPDFLIDQIPPSKHSRGNRFGWETFWEIRGGGWGSMEGRKLLWHSKTKTSNPARFLSLYFHSHSCLPDTPVRSQESGMIWWNQGRLTPTAKPEDPSLTFRTHFVGGRSKSCMLSPDLHLGAMVRVYTENKELQIAFKLVNLPLAHLWLSFLSLGNRSKQHSRSHSISRAIIHSSFRVTPLTQQHLTLLQSVAQTSPPAWGTSPVINQVWERHGTFLNALTVQVNFFEKQTWGDTVFFSHETLWPLSSPRSKDGSGEASCIITGPRAKMAMQRRGWN